MTLPSIKASVVFTFLFIISCANPSLNNTPARTSPSRTILLQYLEGGSSPRNTYIDIVKSVLEKRGYVVHVAPPLVKTSCIDLSVKKGDILRCPKALANGYKDYDAWCFYELDCQSLERQDNRDIVHKKGRYVGVIEFSTPYVYQVEAYTVNIRIVDSVTDSIVVNGEGYSDCGECKVKFRRSTKWDPRYAKSLGVDRSEIEGHRYHICENDAEEQVQIAVEAALAGW